ncbi:MAG: hypothetical protein ABR524_11040 [Thermoanaerobaculia bacterium]
MPEPRHVRPSSGDTLLLVGTMKGAFIFRSADRGAQWEMGGPYFPAEAGPPSSWIGALDRP